MISLKDQAIQNALAGEWQKAVAINKSLLKEDPQDIDALNRLAFAFSILGKTKDAKTAYQKVLKIDSLNPLALRNLKRIASSKKIKNGDGYATSASSMRVTNMFIEEQGKTKIVELVNIAQPSVINTLRTGQSLTLSVKRLKIFVLGSGKRYIGVLPDNIGKRLIKFLKAGNLYEAYVKSAYDHHIIIFIKETKRASRLKDQPSFISIFEKGLELGKKISKPRANIDTDYEEEPSEEDEE
ncbi:MAG: hypothetical protein A3H50_03435 [Candidatus Levybacteria bacterium RIFCSPLOWO2_02_FULL_37_10]|nr:MAG: hypothetical protein A2860_04730 [Candidatus Levybacteria bacterium RIFCSPHIGHO2_01_FULL_37_33]OGH15644.1 MAG: hypothetical protein A3C97_02150 [Candidatus Levybacteria bacterium RIFCSPHIGHO2_02_FULL_37_11]OGH30131.1 MAG: hypothetical protein A3F30_00200 [Candidatus Levybacteria bacterium RIFCSPHIGHO2_12_FULL_37_12]OGH33115.1 MAG: hypothetical protein A2953_03550 [Candidatus Levybacteria bacterium RIFCSPLOWO2_01_FULL_36_54]OGH43319.1 MAG: hypothetical protein A3H50_03435 [Candidatus Lev